MRIRTVLAATFLVALLVSGVALTQPRPEGEKRGPDAPPPGPPPGGLERLLDELKLADKQKDKAQEILRAHHEKVRAIMDQARADLLKQMKDVLTEEQFKKFKDDLERQRPPGPPRGPRDGPPRERPEKP